MKCWVDGWIAIAKEGSSAAEWVWSNIYTPRSKWEMLERSRWNARIDEPRPGCWVRSERIRKEEMGGGVHAEQVEIDWMHDRWG